MATKIIAIIPTPEWREALLGDGPCGSRAPKLSRFEGPARYAKQGIWWHFDVTKIDRPGHVIDRGEELPLLWEGEPVPDGIARAVRALGGEVKGYDDPVCEIVDAAAVELAGNPPGHIGTLRLLAVAMKEAGIASEVVADERTDLVALGIVAQHIYQQEQT